MQCPQSYLFNISRIATAAEYVLVKSMLHLTGLKAEAVSGWRAYTASPKMLISHPANVKPEAELSKKYKRKHLAYHFLRKSLYRNP